MERVRFFLVVVYTVAIMAGSIFITTTHEVDFRNKTMMGVGTILLDYSYSVLVVTVVFMFGRSKYPKILICILGIITYLVLTRVGKIIIPF